MDLVLARQKAQQPSYTQKVSMLAEAQLRGMAMQQDQAAAFNADCLGVLRQSGLLSIELGAHHPNVATQPCGLTEGRFADTVAAIRALSRVDPAAAVLVHVHNALVVKLVQRFGTPAQKDTWLPRLATRVIGAFAATEAHAGSDLRQMHTQATPTADGFVLHGEKHWITNAAEAGLFIVFASLGENATAAFLVDAQTPGVSVGPRIDKMSMRASSTCSVRFDGVKLTQADMLGDARMGMDVAMYGLVCGRIGIAAQMLGIAEAAHALALDYACQRVAFGSPIIQHQGVSFPLAQVATEITAADLLLREATQQLEQGKPHLKVSDLANKAKLFASQVAERATAIGVETMGGNGVATSHVMERLYRDAKVGKIYEGTVNVLLRSIADAMRK